MPRERPGTQELYRSYARVLEHPAPAPPPPHLRDNTVGWLWQAVEEALAGDELHATLAKYQQIAETFYTCVQTGGERQACVSQADPSLRR